MSALAAKNAFALFLAQFGELCREHGGTYNEKDAILDGAAYRIPTPLGELRASTSYFRPPERGRNFRSTEQIYLCWRDYTGPVPFPLHGDFNSYSHKWNIIYAGGSAGEARKHALNELKIRLELLAEMKTGEVIA